MRPRGRWGDMIIALIPIYWCTNILINSNALLKVIEWQDSASLLTVRVRAKQWYWVYKVSTLSNIRAYDYNISIGRNSSIRLSVLNANNSEKTFAGFWLNWQKTFFYKYVSLRNKNPKYDLFVINKGGVENGNTSGTESGLIVSDEYVRNIVRRVKVKQSLRNIHFDYVIGNMRTREGLSNVKTGYTFTKAQRSRVIISRANPFANLSIKKRTFSYSENTLVLEKAYEGNNLFNFIFEEKNRLFKKHRYFLTLRQKPLKKWNSYLHSLDFVYNNAMIPKELRSMVGLQRAPYTNNFYLSNNNRLLNTTTLLVLPTNTTISIITNSFDVIHSWFIPGLGLKLDCVPGRSTHHILKIDVPGFYYGQCAEICGRFHHHMPIKICAVPFEHFLLWWQHYFVYLNMVDDWEKAVKMNRLEYAYFFIK